MSAAAFEQAADVYRSRLEEHASLQFVNVDDTAAQRRAVEDLQRAYLALRTTEEGRLVVESMTSDSCFRVAVQACSHALAWDSPAAKARLASFVQEGEPWASMARLILAEYERGEDFVRGLSWTPSS